MMTTNEDEDDDDSAAAANDGVDGDGDVLMTRLMSKMMTRL